MKPQLLEEAISAYCTGIEYVQKKETETKEQESFIEIDDFLPDSCDDLSDVAQNTEDYADESVGFESIELAGQNTPAISSTSGDSDKVLYHDDSSEDYEPMCESEEADEELYSESSEFFSTEIDLTDLQLLNIFNPVEDFRDYFNLEENPFDRLSLPNFNGGIALYLVEQHRESLRE